MAKRVKIGLCLFFDNYSNSGIVNYLYNIVSALNSLPHNKKPAIVLLYSKNAPVAFIESIGYPYLKSIEWKPHPSYRLTRVLNAYLIKITRIDWYQRLRYFRKMDCLYPYFEFYSQGLENANNKIHWLVDFNNKAFSQHYEDGGRAMTEFQEQLTQRKDRIVLSSYSLLNELKAYYPSYKNEIKVLRFACSLPVLNERDFEPILKKHLIDYVYLMSPNQFWEHKNQIIVIEAIQKLRNKYANIPFRIVFTGSLEVNRGKGKYAEMLRNKIEEYGLTSYIRFLGVLERYEQLVLMKNAIALVQPSLYEGWSTLVEEAKALNKFIILSNIPVHKEQIDSNCAFFDPGDIRGLATEIEKAWFNAPVLNALDYKKNIEEYGYAVLDALTMP